MVNFHRNLKRNQRLTSKSVHIGACAAAMFSLRYNNTENFRIQMLTTWEKNAVLKERFTLETIIILTTFSPRQCFWFKKNAN